MQRTHRPQRRNQAVSREPRVVRNPYSRAASRAAMVTGRMDELPATLPRRH